MPTEMTNNSIDSNIDAPQAQAEALQRVIAELSRLRSDDRRRIVETVATFFGLNLQLVGARHFPTDATEEVPSQNPNQFRFSGKSVDPPTVKAFVLEKSPQTDVERVACLAYYLTNYRSTPHFKTKDISLINTESAHRAFSNTANAVENATKMSYLVPSVKGCKQLSAYGEQFVEALPDRAAAEEVLERLRRRKSSSKRENTKAGRQ